MMTNRSDDISLLHEIDLSPARKGMNTAFKFQNNSKLELRPPQHQFIYSTYEGIMNRRDVIIEGPTGLGKTRSLFASILPLLCSDQAARVIYLTRTKTQVQNIINEISEIASLSCLSPSILSATPFMGMAAIASTVNCFTPKPGALEIDQKKCSNCRLQNKVKQTPEDASGVFDFDDMTQISNEGFCPSSTIKALLKSKRIIVAPQGNILNQEWVAQANIDKTNTVVLVDEAHNFITDQCAGSYLGLFCATDDIPFDCNSPLSKNLVNSQDIASNQFSLRRLLQLNESTRFNNTPIENNISTLVSLTIDLLNNLANTLNKLQNGDAIWHRSNDILAEDAYEFSHHFKKNSGSLLTRCHKILSSLKESERSIAQMYYKLPRLYFSAKHIIEALSNIIKQPFEFYIEYNSEHKAFSATAIHPKMIVNRALNNFRCAIFTSATISPIEDAALMLGKPNALQIQIDHLFSENNYLHFFVCGAHSSIGSENINPDSTPFSRHEKERIQSVVSGATKAAIGKNIGVFFNSLANMQWFAQTLMKHHKSIVPDHTFILGQVSNNQSKWTEEEQFLVDQFNAAVAYLNIQDQNHDPREHVSEVFMKLGNQNKTAILLGVQGGKLAEGVDYNGNKMEMVLLIGLPYPGSNNEIAISNIKKDYWGMIFERSNNKADDFAYKYDAFRKLAQSAGRAHRSTKDQAVIIFVDERLVGLKNTGTKNYDLLSPKNTLKNYRLLPPPIHRFEKNIVTDNWGRQQHYLQNHIKKLSPQITNDSFIELNSMVTQIKNFFKEK